MVGLAHNVKYVGEESRPYSKMVVSAPALKLCFRVNVTVNTSYAIWQLALSLPCYNTTGRA